MTLAPALDHLDPTAASLEDSLRASRTDQVRLRYVRRLAGAALVVALAAAGSVVAGSTTSAWAEDGAPDTSAAVPLPTGTPGESRVIPGTVGQPFSLAPAGGQIPGTAFTVTSGSLPPGLSIDPTTGSVSGTPTTSGTFAASLRVTGLLGGVDTPVSFVIAPAARPAGPAPPKRALGANAGRGGGPDCTQHPSRGAVWGFWGGVESRFSFVRARGARRAGPAPTISGLRHIGVLLGGPFSTELQIRGAADAKVTVVAGALPPGTSLSALSAERTRPAEVPYRSALVEGTATTAGHYEVTFRVTDANGSADLTMSVDVAAPKELTFRPTRGKPFTRTLDLPPGATDLVVWAASIPPAGLTYDPGTRTISGTPTSAGTTVLKLVGLNKDDAGTLGLLDVTFEVTDPAAPTITLDDIARTTGTAGRPFALTPGGRHASGASFTISDGALPSGLTLDAETGTISGTVPTPGTFTATITVTDENGAASLPLRLEFVAAAATAGELALTGVTVSTVSWAVGLLLLLGGLVLLIFRRATRPRRSQEK